LRGFGEVEARRRRGGLRAKHPLIKKNIHTTQHMHAMHRKRVKRKHKTSVMNQARKITRCITSATK
jgi:hypothetical protein